MNAALDLRVPESMDISVCVCVRACVCLHMYPNMVVWTIIKLLAPFSNCNSTYKLSHLWNELLGILLTKNIFRLAQALKRAGGK